MDINDIDQLQIDPNTGLYDLTQRTFQSQWAGINYYSYVVQEGEEMRIDLICQSIYNSIDYTDILLDVNNISNPLNIKEGTIIIYPAADQISDLRYTDTSQNVQSLATTQKAPRLDPNRQNYVNQQYQLPPTVLNTPSEQVSLNGNTIVVGNGLFNT